MVLYEVIERDDHDVGISDVSYGIFSTYEKASDLINKFKGYDGFGVCEEDFCIIERVPDIVEDWVLELLDRCKQNKKQYEKNEYWNC